MTVAGEETERYHLCVPVPKGSTLDPERTRADVLAAATPLLYEHGIDGIGVAELCAEAGISKQTLYRHFGSKEGLVQAVLEQRSARVGRWLHDAAQSAGDAPADRMAAVFDALGEWFAEPQFRGCVVMNAAAQHHAEPVLGIAGRHLQMLRELFTSIAHDAGAPDADVLGRQLLQLLEGATVVASASVSTTPERDPGAAARDARAAALTLLRAASAKQDAQ